MQLHDHMLTALATQPILIIALLSVLASASSTTASPSQKSLKATGTNSICPSRTVNYITHGLPQQCLATSLRTATGTASANATTSILSEFPSEIDHTETATVSSTGSGVYNGVVLDATTSGAVTTDDGSSSKAPTQRAEPSSSTSAVSVATSIPDVSEEPSPLEDGQFISFEEWKRQTLQKAGQSEHVEKEMNLEHRGSRKRPANMHAVLDSLGDDAEIDLDFSGFIPEGPELVSSSQTSVNGESESEVPSEENSSLKTRKRSKDAGTTCKERFNYASFDCAANVLKFNPEAKSASSVLGENKDSYMLNECSAKNKFLILELCDDISIDTIVLANFEFFSSIFRTFRVSVSNRYPVKIDKWKTLGTFEARNSRDVQAFLVENPVIWARYLRIEFLTHYGNEFYCPLSLVRVHGTTMLEEYKRDQDSLQVEDDDDNGAPDPGSIVAEDGLTPEAIAVPIAQEGIEENGKLEEEGSAQEVYTQQEAFSSVPVNTAQHEGSLLSEASETSQLHSTTVPGTSVLPIDENIQTTALPVEICVATDTVCGASHSPFGKPQLLGVGLESKSATTSSTTGSSFSGFPISSASYNGEKINAAVSSVDTAAASSSTIILDTVSSSTPVSISNAIVNITQTDRVKASSTTTQAQPAAPTMQESFFKSVQKRLQMLETNSSLSLQYIEAQSRALRDAFNKVEQRQLAKTTAFLEYLNTTVLNELRDFRQQYDQLWQSTVIELEMQRERYQQENFAINARLGVLADEVIFQKRMSILQMVLILVCLALVLFAKGNLNAYLEMPIVQSMLARSPSTKWTNWASLDTPSQSPPLTRTRSAHQLRTPHGILKGHRRMQSEDSVDGTVSSTDLFAPPTPVSYGDVSDDEGPKDGKLDDPKFDPSTIERPSTSPPILPSIETPSKPAFSGSPECETIDSRLLNSVPNTTKDLGLPEVVVEQATPTSKQLKWKLPEE